MRISQVSFDELLECHQYFLRGRLVIFPYKVFANAESALLAQQRAQVELMARQWDAQIMLAKALGGGFASPAPDAIARR